MKNFKVVLFIVVVISLLAAVYWQEPVVEAAYVAVTDTPVPTETPVTPETPTSTPPTMTTTPETPTSTPPTMTTTPGTPPSTPPITLTSTSDDFYDCRDTQCDSFFGEWAKS